MGIHIDNNIHEHYIPSIQIDIKYYSSKFIYWYVMLRVLARKGVG